MTAAITTQPFRHESPDRRVNDVDYLSSEEVMKVLGIKKASLYTYVSRGLVRTIKQPGQKKANLYLKADVDALRTRGGDGAGGPTISHSLRYGDPVVQSWICDITPAGPRYRGHLALDLVEARRSFEYVAELIWGGLPRLRDSAWVREPGVFGVEGLAGPAGFESRGHESATRLLARTALAMTSLERPSSETAYLGRTAGIRLIQAFAAAAGYLGPRRAPEPQGDSEHVAAFLLRGLGGAGNDPSAINVLNTALVLSADHELSAPTFVARICASTGVDLYACVVAALMAHCGPMQMGGAADLEDMLQSGDPSPLVSSLDAPCFGHPLYATDPRAECLLAVTARCTSVTGPGRRLLEAIESLRTDTGRYPNLFGALVIMARALGLPPGAASLINTVGRTAGWIAHAVEQRHAGSMLRPRARYMGG
ncbi:citrate synthase [Ottowia thiooxydans]|uniref:citrate synthase n=1 Tax=Ottowia thiooxydans TaxID=219182 RepID=UPI000422700E|nr:citrate synthase [Ottowia thiooxydans]